MLYLITLDRLYGRWGVVVRPMSEVVFFKLVCRTSDDITVIEFAVKSPLGQQEHFVKMGEIVTEAALPEQLTEYQGFAEQDNEGELERKEAKDGEALPE